MTCNSEAIPIYPLRPASVACGGMKDKAPASLVAYLGLPGDPRGICLALGWLGVGLLGVASLVSGDLIGLLYVALAIAGYLFVHARPLSVCLWAGVAVAGLWLTAGGNALGLLQAVVAIAFGVVAAWPPPRSAQVVIPAGGTALVETGAAPPALRSDASSTRLQVRTVGSLRITLGDADLTGQLNDRPLLAFIWLYLLARAVRWPGETLTRSALADELAPKLAATEQSKRLKSQLWDLKHDLPAQLRDPVRADRHSVSLDLSAADLDVFDLRELDRALQDAGPVIKPELANQIQEILERLSDADFLPGFDDLEQKITGGAGSAGQVVRDVRQEVDALRANLALALADFESLSERPDRAIAVLERALRRAEGRPDLASRLAALCARYGNVERAAELRRTYQLASEG
jgi:hypothetical protein